MTILEELDTVLQEWGERVVGKIQENLDSTGTTASGRTKDSIELVVGNGELTIYGRQYFRGVEQGRPGGGIPYRFQDILYQWASDKGILSNFGETESKQRSALYMVGQFIKNNGTKLYRSGGRDDIYTSVFDEELPVLDEQIGVMVRETIANGLK